MDSKHRPTTDHNTGHHERIAQKPTVSVIYENELDATNSMTSLDYKNYSSTEKIIIPDPTDIIYTLNGDGSMSPMYEYNPQNPIHFYDYTQAQIIDEKAKSSSTQSIPMRGQVSTIRVTREQYWSCNLPQFHCTSWTKREKILFIILIILSIIIIVLAGCYTIKYSSDNKPPATQKDWLPWKF